MRGQCASESHMTPFGSKYWRFAIRACLEAFATNAKRDMLEHIGNKTNHKHVHIARARYFFHGTRHQQWNAPYAAVHIMSPSTDKNVWKHILSIQEMDHSIVEAKTSCWRIQSTEGITKQNMGCRRIQATYIQDMKTSLDSEYIDRHVVGINSSRCFMLI